MKIPNLRTFRVPRLPLTIGLVVFFVGAGTGIASAGWTAPASTLGSTATAATLAFTQSGADQLDKDYGSSALVDFAPITVKNTGTVANAFTLLSKSSTGNNLSNAITVSGWSVTSAVACTQTPPSGAAITSATLSTGITLTGASLAPSASAFWCLRTTLPSVTNLEGTNPAIVTVTVSSAIGSWVSASTASATQRVLDTTAPTVPGSPAASGTTTTQTTITWAASTDSVGVTAYDVYRAGILIATVTSNSYTNTGLASGTTYSFTVRARDAAGNVSGASPAVTVNTPGVNPGYRYTIKNPNSGLCIDADSGNTVNGTLVEIYTCSFDVNGVPRDNQTWQFTETDSGYYKVLPIYSTILAWDIDLGSTQGKDDFARAQLWSYGGGTNQQWMPVVETDGSTHFVNRNSGKCLDINGATNVSGTQLQQYTCNGTVAQKFTLTPVS